MADIEIEAGITSWPDLSGGAGLLGDLTRLVQADTAPYVKRDTDETMNSAKHSDFASGVITYSASDKKGRQYAGYAYMDPHVAKSDTDKHPKAAAKWFEAAKADRLSDWVRYVAERVAGGAR
nr:MAG TPA: Minor capsid protein [Caudoviricetes sp.]